MHFWIAFLLLVFRREGAAIIVASTIVPPATFNPRSASTRYLTKQLIAQMVLFQQMTEVQYRGFIRYRHIPDQCPQLTHRSRIVERFFHTGQTSKPMLQKINAKHDFQSRGGRPFQLGVTGSIIERIAAKA